MDTTPTALDQVRRALTRVRTGSSGRTRSWTRSAAPGSTPRATMSRRSSFVRNASRYVSRPPDR
jgi:hypothetical protein